MDIDRAALDRTVTLLKARLLQSRTPAGCWQGQLSSSALSTATASFALAMVDKTKYSSLICKGLEWLSANQNPDGGWGDTIHSISNISTTLLCWSAFTISDAPHRFKDTVTKTELWLTNAAGQGEALHRIKPNVLADSVNKQYGEDRTFSAPILTMCALAGRLGNPKDAWRLIKPLPFELSIFPHQLFKWLHLPVVSYALPALIAIGQVHYHYRKPANPIARALRFLSRNRTLSVLQSLQPENGGFLEAIPLTAFVVMSLAAIGEKNNDVVSKGAEFLVNSARPDGSWPIDTNLAVWVTTLAVNALSAGLGGTAIPSTTLRTSLAVSSLHRTPYGGAGIPCHFESTLSPDDHTSIQDWLLLSQQRQVHPYTHAAPGGWGWTNLPGAVPDADDTAGALIVLRNLGPPDKYTTDAALSGIEWLLKLQNRDGGFPTFCRGWMSLPFDRSAPDLTAHTIAAVSGWLNELPGSMQKPAKIALRKALAYLERAQKKDGSWIPLWFGNQFSPNQENPTYGTSRVLICLCRLPGQTGLIQSPMVQKAVQWLLSAQNQDGGWGGAKGVKPTIEETALSVDALASILDTRYSILDTRFARHRLAVEPAISRGASWLIEQIGEGASIVPSPIGLYFAKLWYFEELYPVIFTLSALQKVRNLQLAL